MTGTIGLVTIYSANKSALINQNIVRLIPNGKIFNTDVLALYIQLVGKIFLERIQTGNVQPYVNIPNFETLIVPLIEKNVQNGISKYIQESFNHRHISKHLLQSAKTAVELAIEEGEAAALLWLKETTPSVFLSKK